MTEHLSALLRDEAAALDVPPVDRATILARGQRDRARRRSRSLLAAAAVLAVIGGGAALAVDRGSAGEKVRSATDPAAHPALSPSLVSYGSDSRVVLNGRASEVPGTLHSLSYTSVGVLARSNDHDGASDGSGPERLTLIAEDGTTIDLGRVPEGVGPATDPDEPVYALAEKSGAGFSAVLRDALTGEEVSSVPLPVLPMSHWSVPPLALDGDIVYAGFKTQAVAFNWRTGAAQPAAGLGGGIPDVRDGRTVVSAESSFDVVDAATGDPLLVLEHTTSADATGVLSPDGRFLRYKVESMSGRQQDTGGLEIYDLEGDADPVRLPGAIYEWGWTSGGFPFNASNATAEVCNPVTGSCAVEKFPPVGQNVRFGGNVYES